MSDESKAKDEAKDAAKDEAKALKSVGADQVQAKMDEEQAKGYHGVDEDPLKPDGYTLQGSVARAEESKL